MNWNESMNSHTHIVIQFSSQAQYITPISTTKTFMCDCKTVNQKLALEAFITHEHKPTNTFMLFDTF